MASNDINVKLVGRDSEKCGIGRDILPGPASVRESSLLCCGASPSSVPPDPVVIADDRLRRHFCLLPDLAKLLLSAVPPFCLLLKMPFVLRNAVGSSSRPGAAAVSSALARTHRTHRYTSTHSRSYLPGSPPASPEKVVVLTDPPTHLHSATFGMSDSNPAVASFAIMGAAALLHFSIEDRISSAAICPLLSP
ncbi:hypothetical protein KR51_00020080 [Rubidibacter lacunae KORDI 51-2]|uniref:Uncharacterized protein n=1 Tax=Rubidibacter lacunae KORDI 51-2 TaxID=582515 RepID=U5DID8_9CHRO|nr:hypothetical protein KR51_00020080 [Rubidibacter lacunae KORDI 51-2]